MEKKYIIIGASVYLNTPSREPYGVVTGVDASVIDARLYVRPHEGNNTLLVIKESTVKYLNRY